LVLEVWWNLCQEVFTEGHGHAPTVNVSGAGG
jgi:hypothetical protein